MVCVYPCGFTFKNGPEKKDGIFYSYRPHNLHRQYGYHLVYNNQYNVNGVPQPEGYRVDPCQVHGCPPPAVVHDRAPYNRTYYRFVNCGG